MSKKINLQILRILACFGVFIVHVGQRMSFDGTLRIVTDFGQYGVELFLILSGYLAFFSFNNLSGVGNTINYYKKRVIRLLPLYYFSILFFFLTETFVWKSIKPDELHLGWLRYIFLLNGFLGSKTYLWGNIGITWTIPLFAFFYLITPLLRKILKKLRHSVMFFAIAYLLGTISRNYLQFGFDNNTILFFNDLIYCRYFALGIVIFFIYKEKKELHSILNFTIFATILAILENMTMLYAILFAIIFIASNFVNDIQIPVCVSKIINVLDDYSYSLYLGHGIIFCGLLDKISFSKPIIAIIAIFGTFLVTIILRNFIERPLQKLLKQVLLKKEIRFK